MRSLKLDGTALAKLLNTRLLERSAALKEKFGLVPVLATILVGEDPASVTYVRMKGNACVRAGIESRKVVLPADTGTEALIREIEALNADPAVFGILLQHPVPAQIDERACFEAIAPEKDVDGVGCHGFGRMAMGLAAFGSATPEGIIVLLDHYGIPIEGKRAVVVGRSPILGKPVAMMLLNRNATVTICHSKTKDLEKLIGEADILVAAVGKPKFVKAAWLKEGCVLVDAGYNAGNVGDSEWEEAVPRCEAYAPVPGGVGPLTIVTLIGHCIDAAERKLRLR
jgi:methylenetetrahydrofolate dehydrogenase (NADP+) / methenyltetrahydrofolate cyclohydrolase